MGYWSVSSVQAQALLWTDDVVLIADTQERLQVTANEWLEDLQRKGMEINPLKSKVMGI